MCAAPTSRQPPTSRQRRLASLVLCHPEWPLARCCREAGYSEAEWDHHAMEVWQRQGTQAAVAALRTTYRAQVLAVVPTERAAQRLGELVDSQDERVALRALTTAMEHAGVVEQTDQRQIITIALQTVVAALAPVLRPCIDPAKEALLAAGLDALALQLGGSQTGQIANVSAMAETKQDAATVIVAKKNGKNGHGNGTDAGF